MALTKKEIKIFDMNNPNCNFVEKPAHYMFYNKPLIKRQGKYEERVVGVIPDGSYIIEKEDGFYTDVIFWWGVDSTLEFKNYEVEGNIVVDDVREIKAFEIKNVLSIEVG